MPGTEKCEFTDLYAVARRLGVSYNTAKAVIAAGDIPHVRVGCLYRVRVTDLDAYIARGGQRRGQARGRRRMGENVELRSGVDDRRAAA